MGTNSFNFACMRLLDRFPVSGRLVGKEVVDRGKRGRRMRREHCTIATQVNSFGLALGGVVGFEKIQVMNEHI